MKNKLINKLGIGALGLALAGSFWGCDKENPEIVKYEEKGYVDFCDVKNKKVYTDLGKDNSLDIIYDTKMYPIFKALVIVDDSSEAEKYDEQIIYRKYAGEMQKAFEKIKQNYEKQKK